MPSQIAMGPSSSQGQKDLRLYAGNTRPPGIYPKLWLWTVSGKHLQWSKRGIHQLLHWQSLWLKNTASGSSNSVRYLLQESTSNWSLLEWETQVPPREKLVWISKGYKDGHQYQWTMWHSGRVYVWNTMQSQCSSGGYTTPASTSTLLLWNFWLPLQNHTASQTHHITTLYGLWFGQLNHLNKEETRKHWSSNTGNPHKAIALHHAYKKELHTTIKGEEMNQHLWKRHLDKLVDTYKVHGDKTIAAIGRRMKKVEARTKKVYAKRCTTWNLNTHGGISYL